MSLSVQEILGRFEGTTDEPLDDTTREIVEAKLIRCGECGRWTRNEDVDIEGLCGLCEDEAEK